MADAQLFDDSFYIDNVGEKTYDRVARVYGTSSDGATKMTLDYCDELYSLQRGETVHMLLADTLNLDGSADEVQKRGWRPNKHTESTLADMYEYVCYGKVYMHRDPQNGGKIEVYISFGGLLLCLVGPYKKLSPLRRDNVYMLLKK
ncbi:DNA-directed RNA polymerases i, ii, and iii 145 kDa polypeptide [Piedraia hortae CBS 480.64]|uniref:DNA-directed RNA polymerases I, II, and III subunit RPABC3 n=1 Tax=Piedraia hortae CBS 480.64 TaxID=1314780 RepID=A0A6A7C6Z4_9PEZI|nr:DNA-directed RNA polymerases i, ii, and iii 145 kDa polypeptide [Piedraia hortae CBS 480.64]